MQIQNNSNVNFRGEPEIMRNLIQAWKKAHVAVRLGDSLGKYPGNRAAYLCEVGEVRGLLDAATSDREFTKVIDTFTPQSREALQKATDELDKDFQMDFLTRARCYSLFMGELLQKAWENVITNIKKLSDVATAITPSIKAGEKATSGDISDFESLINWPGPFNTQPMTEII